MSCKYAQTPDLFWYISNNIFALGQSLRAVGTVSIHLAEGNLVKKGMVGSYTMQDNSYFFSLTRGNYVIW